MAWSTFRFIDPVRGMHIGHSGSTVRPDEGLNNIAVNYEEGREAFTLRHRPNGTHNDSLIARAVMIFVWDNENHRYEIDAWGQWVLQHQSNPIVAGEVTLIMRPMYNGQLWLKGALRTTDLTARIGVSQTGPRTILVKTHTYVNIETDEPYFTPYGYDFSLEIKYGQNE